MFKSQYVELKLNNGYAILVLPDGAILIMQPAELTALRLALNVCADYVTSGGGPDGGWKVKVPVVSLMSHGEMLGDAGRSRFIYVRVQYDREVEEDHIRLDFPNAMTLMLASTAEADAFAQAIIDCLEASEEESARKAWSSRFQVQWSMVRTSIAPPRA